MKNDPRCIIVYGGTGYYGRKVVERLLAKGQTIIRDDLKGLRLRLTGPKAYTFPEVAEISGNKSRHITIPLNIIYIVSLLLLPFNPFVRFLYKSLKLLNNFPADLAKNVPNDHRLLRELFDYEPVSLEMEIRERFGV